MHDERPSFLAEASANGEEPLTPADVCGPDWAGLFLSHHEFETVGLFGGGFQFSVSHTAPGRDVDFGGRVVSQDRHLRPRFGSPQSLGQTDHWQWTALSSVVQSFHVLSMPRMVAVRSHRL